MQESQVSSMGWEDLLEKGMATHSSMLAWEITWTQKPSGVSTICGVTELDMIHNTFTFSTFSLSNISHSNGSIISCS